jgi:hypothetical protein
MAPSDAHPAAEVLEENAAPSVKRVYDDIKAAFRVPLVNLVFRDLARHPDFLQLAWRQLHPNVQTVYFERQADLLRARAVEVASGLGTAPPLEDEEASTTLQVFHYVNPKILLAVAALRSAVGGQYPKLEELPAAEKRKVPGGVPTGAPEIMMVDASVEGPSSALLSEIRAATGVPLVNSDYRALARWPDYLTEAWRCLRAARAEESFVRREREIRLMAERAILILPFRMDVSAHTMRLCGLDEQSIDEVRSILNLYYRALPGLIVSIAFLSIGALGAERARQSPFPVDLSAPAPESPPR